MYLQSGFKNTAITERTVRLWGVVEKPWSATKIAVSEESANSTTCAAPTNVLVKKSDSALGGRKRDEIVTNSIWSDHPSSDDASPDDDGNPHNGAGDQSPFGRVRHKIDWNADPHSLIEDKENDSYATLIRGRFKEETGHWFSQCYNNLSWMQLSNRKTAWVTADPCCCSYTYICAFSSYLHCNCPYYDPSCSS